jgi:alkaline phosphatase
MRGRFSGVVLALLGVVALAALACPLGAQPATDSAILLIGDGMGPVQVQIGREAAGGQPLAMERMPFSGRATNPPAEGDVTDSAAAATALATGRKTKNGMIGVTPNGEPVENLLERARQLGKSTGVITTDSLTGATPAGFMAHVDSRGKRDEIALQEYKAGVQVMLGFWKGAFTTKAQGGAREDGRDLIGEMEKSGYQAVYTKDQLEAATSARLVGFFDDGPQAPSIAQMVSKALSILSKNPKGFVLVVESARIDWASHDNELVGAVLATLDLDGGVAKAVEFARERGRTLVVVTADHETGGPKIEEAGKLPLVRSLRTEPGEIAKHLNGDRTNIAAVMREYASIGDLSEDEVVRIREAGEPAAAIATIISARAGISWRTGSHTATPVPVFAFGPKAERFSGQMDNTDIPKRLAETIGLGTFPK